VRATQLESRQYDLISSISLVCVAESKVLATLVSAAEAVNVIPRKRHVVAIFVFMCRSLSKCINFSWLRSDGNLGSLSFKQLRHAPAKRMAYVHLGAGVVVVVMPLA
jgi:hypothetical protein